MQCRRYSFSLLIIVFDWHRVILLTGVWRHGKGFSTPEEAAASAISAHTVKKYARKGTVLAIKVGGVWRFQSRYWSQHVPICPASIRYGALWSSCGQCSGGLVEQAGLAPKSRQPTRLHLVREENSQPSPQMRSGRGQPCSVEEFIREAKEGQRFRGDE